MLKGTISGIRLKAMADVEQYIKDHPQSTLEAVGEVLRLPKTTLQSYTTDLCELGRMTMKRERPAGRGSRPGKFTVVAGLPPLDALGAPVTRKALQDSVTAARFAPGLVASFFGAAGREND